MPMNGDINIARIKKRVLLPSLLHHKLHPFKAIGTAIERKAYVAYMPFVTFHVFNDVIDIILKKIRKT
jgi:hypothetical protein